jgi:protein-S-isoprenylcysteine O-methyltransferase Ste14
LFLTCKYLVIGVWIGMSLQSWGIGFQAVAGVSALRWLSIGLWICGFGFLYLGRINLGSHVRIGLPNESTALHRNGAYRFCRNPMYAGIDATMVAAILYTRNPVILVLGAFIIAAHHKIILAEERWLLATFGGEYERYRDRVGRYATLRFTLSKPGGRGTYRIRCLRTLLRMGHCAPTIMRTILDGSGRNQDWLVRLVAGLPGGIGNTGGECGGITSALVLLGLRHGLGRIQEGLPLVFDQGHEHLQRFQRTNATLLCREIRGTPPRLWPCVRTILRSPELYAELLTHDSRQALAGEVREAYRLLFAAFTDCGFHCAHEVLRHLDHLIPSGPELLDGTSAFLGGMLFKGLTCSALTAGVMAVGLRIAEIETSPWRVLRMIALMLTGGPAFEDRINKFNRTMNLGGELAKWFAGVFGSTQCRAVTQADFSSAAEVRAYIRGGGIGVCQRIAKRVAEHVQLIHEENLHTRQQGYGL